MRSTVLNLIRFKTAHTGEASYIALLHTITARNLEKFFHSVTTDNATDILEKVTPLREQLYATHCMESHCPHGHFHVRFFAHVFNLAGKEWMGPITDKIFKIRNLIGCLRC